MKLYAQRQTTMYIGGRQKCKKKKKKRANAREWKLQYVTVCDGSCEWLKDVFGFDTAYFNTTMACAGQMCDGLYQSGCLLTPKQTFSSVTSSSNHERYGPTSGPLHITRPVARQLGEIPGSCSEAQKVSRA